MSPIDDAVRQFSSAHRSILREANRDVGSGAHQ
jgi:hypothetical protein